MSGGSKSSLILAAAALALSLAGGAEAADWGRFGNGNGRGAKIREEILRRMLQPQAVTGTAVQDFIGEGASREMPTLNVKANVADQSGARAQNGAKVTVGQITVVKTGKTSSEFDSDYRGLNAGVVAAQGSRIVVNGGTVRTEAEGGNAFFAWGEGATIKASGVEIATAKNSSRGLNVADGGAIEGENLTINTKGAKSAAVSVIRDGGTVKAKKVQAKTHGDDSPGIFASGGEVAIEDGSFDAYAAEAVVIDADGVVTLKNCDLKGRDKGGVMIYQDAADAPERGKGELRMTGGALESKSGPLFFVTNVPAARIVLDGVKLTSGASVLVKAAVSRWGATGGNGGHLTLEAVNQTLKGNVTVDDISDVSLKLGEATRLTGALNRQGAAGEVNLELGKGAIWEVAADSCVDQLTCPEKNLDELKARIKSNGHVVRYRVKNELLNGDKIPLDYGGMLVFATAPAKKAPVVNDKDKNKNKNKDKDKNDDRNNDVRVRGNRGGFGGRGGFNFPPGVGRPR